MNVYFKIHIHLTPGDEICLEDGRALAIQIMNKHRISLKMVPCGGYSDHGVTVDSYPVEVENEKEALGIARSIANMIANGDLGMLAKVSASHIIETFIGYSDVGPGEDMG